MSQQPPPQVVMQADQTRGTEAQKQNLIAVEAITEILKTSLGSNGMDKMLVDSLGDSVITNDGATILKELDVAHPAARILIEASNSTDIAVGDGTTTTVILAGAILAEAKKLLAKNIHPNVIIKTLKKIETQSIIELKRMSKKIDLTDKEIRKVVHTTLASKVVSSESGWLIDLILQLMKDIRDADGSPDLSSIKVEKLPGGSIKDSHVVKGVIIDKEITNPGVPKSKENAKIGLFNTLLEIKKTENDSQVQIQMEQVKQMLDEETKVLKNMSDKIKSAGVDVVVCQKGIDEIVQEYLERDGIIVLKRVKRTDVTNLAKATGARIITSLEGMSSKDLGTAGQVKEKQLDNGSIWVYFEHCKNPRACTVVLRGANHQIVDELDRSMNDAIMVVKDLAKDPYVVVGAGATEIELAKQIKEWGIKSVTGRERLVVKAVANAYLKIPMTLAENAGMDAIDTEIAIESCESGEGINIATNTIGHPTDVFEPLVVKQQVINSAVEAASIILRIDNILRSNKQPTPQ